MCVFRFEFQRSDGSIPLSNKPVQRDLQTSGSRLSNLTLIFLETHKIKEQHRETQKVFVHEQIDRERKIQTHLQVRDSASSYHLEVMITLAVDLTKTTMFKVNSHA